MSIRTAKDRAEKLQARTVFHKDGSEGLCDGYGAYGVYVMVEWVGGPRAGQVSQHHAESLALRKSK